MHSRAFQLTKQRLNPEDYLKEDDLDFEEGMPIPVADYIQDSDREEDIEWFLECLRGGEVNGWSYDKEAQSIAFSEEFASSYFKQAYEAFKTLANQLALEDFASDQYSDKLRTFPTWKLKELIEDKSSFYVYDDWFETFDCFVRKLDLDKRENRTYYFGGTLDYHC